MYMSLIKVDYVLCSVPLMCDPLPFGLVMVRSAPHLLCCQTISSSNVDVAD